MTWAETTTQHVAHSHSAEYVHTWTIQKRRLVFDLLLNGNLITTDRTIKGLKATAENVAGWLGHTK